MAEVASQTIDLVGREVSATLAEARGALEGYVEQPDNSQLLETCAQQLHQVQGVLRLLEIYGAALLAEEMEHVAQYLLATHAERKSQAERLDARRARRAEPPHPRRRRGQARAGCHPPAGVPAVVGDRRGDRGTAGKRPRERAVGKTAPGPRGSGDPPPLRTGRGALLPVSPGRAAQ